MPSDTAIQADPKTQWLVRVLGLSAAPTARIDTPSTTASTEPTKKPGYKDIVINTDSEIEDEADEQAAKEPPQAPPPLPQAAPIDANALKTRITDLVKQMIPRLASEPARKNELMALAKQAQLMLGTNNFKSATAAADELEAILNSSVKPQAQAPTSPPPDQATPAPQTAQKPEAAAPGSEQAEKTLRELIKLMPASIAANPSLKDQLLQFASEANARLKAGHPSEAAASIEALGKLINNASVTTDDVRNRLDEVRGQAARLPDPAKSELQGRVSKMLVELGATNPARLAGEIDTLENDLARATTAARTAEAAAASGDTVSYRLLQSEWVEAQARARQQLDQFVRQVLADKEIQEHPRFDDIKEGLDDAVDLLPDFGNALEGSLAAIDDAASDAARKTARAAALKVLEGYHAALEDADSLRELQAVSNDDYGGLAFYAELQNTLKSLGNQLEKGA